ncbi:MAG: dTMP kinase [Hahellaceae bacterium]|nr:dTMP kinase [Hahellaceae bacterium]MCP5212075.1 dTMP kinase [Hahellaceae bacterium]
MTKGKFITVEGIEGVGKTTNIDFIRKKIDAAGFGCEVTREPGGTPMAEEIRNTLLNNRTEFVCEETELLLMFASRAQHLKQFILPKLSHGDWIVCDRFTDATYAYQGYGRGQSLANIALLENMVQSTFRPDCTILLDAPVEIGLQRAKKRGELDRFEKENIAFFSRVRDGYLELAAKNPHRYRIVDATGAIEEVQQQLSLVIDALIGTP